MTLYYAAAPNKANRASGIERSLLQWQYYQVNLLIVILPMQYFLSTLHRAAGQENP